MKAHQDYRNASRNQRLKKEAQHLVAWGLAAGLVTPAPAPGSTGAPVAEPAPEEAPALAMIKLRPSTTNLQRVLVATADYFSLSVDDLVGPGQTDHISWARTVAATILRDCCDLPIADIAAALNRSTWTVHACLKRAKIKTSVYQHAARDLKAVQLKLQPKAKAA